MYKIPLSGDNEQFNINILGNIMERKETANESE